MAQAATSGVDVFRVFDSLNWVENMRVAMDAVIDSGKVCEGNFRRGVLRAEVHHRSA